MVYLERKTLVLLVLKNKNILNDKIKETKIALCGLRWFKLNVSKCQVVIKMSNV